MVICAIFNKYASPGGSFSHSLLAAAEDSEEAGGIAYDNRYIGGKTRGLG